MAKRTFETQEELDAWYESSIDGIARGLATLVDKLEQPTKINEKGAQHMVVAVTAINQVYTAIYQATFQKAPSKTYQWIEVGKRYL